MTSAQMNSVFRISQLFRGEINIVPAWIVTNSTVKD